MEDVTPRLSETQTSTTHLSPAHALHVSQAGRIRRREKLALTELLRMHILRKQAFFFDTKKIFSKFDETLWVSRYMSNEVIFQISASWVIGNITGRSETDF